jgi:AraC-like DNA-binding protein
MRGLFELALEEGRFVSSSEAHGITTMLADAVATTISDTPQSISRPRSSLDSHARLHRRAMAYIAENLSKPGLNAESISEYCRVSARYVQSAFAAKHTTVGSIVRDLRLDRCRADLENFTLRHKSVTQVAMSWGFNDLAYFSRAFRRRFGCPPSGVRCR